MIIRSEQMEMFESVAEDDFVQRLTAHLRENYAESLVRLPDQESLVNELADETLDLLVRRTIERARLYELSFESSISAFTALRFEVAPNFDRNSVSRLCLTDENIEPNARINELLEVLTEKQWANIRAGYDVNSWLTIVEEENIEEIAEKTEKVGESEKTEIYDFAETVMSGGYKNKPDADNSDFAKTVITAEPPKSTKQSADNLDLDFSQAMFNIDLTKE